MTQTERVLKHIVGEREAVVNRYEEISYIKRYFEEVGEDGH